MLKLVDSHVSLALQLPEPTFGLSKPLAMLRELQYLSRRWLVNTLSLPADTPSSWQRKSRPPLRLLGNASQAFLHHAEGLSAGLCICVRHAAGAQLTRLRNTVES